MVSCASTRMLPDRHLTSRRLAEFSVLALVLAVAAAARLWFLNAGVPHAVGIDEPQVVDRALRILHTGDWNPHVFDYPTLVIYLQAVVAILRFLWGALNGEWASLDAFSIAAVYGAGRFVAAMIGVATVWLTYRIGTELSTRARRPARGGAAGGPSAPRPRIAFHSDRRPDGGAHDAGGLALGARRAPGHRARVRLGRRRLRPRGRGQLQRRDCARRGADGVAPARAVVAESPAHARRHRRRRRGRIPGRRALHLARSARVPRRFRGAVLALRRAGRRRERPRLAALRAASVAAGSRWSVPLAVGRHRRARVAFAPRGSAGCR